MGPRTAGRLSGKAVVRINLFVTLQGAAHALCAIGVQFAEEVVQEQQGASPERWARKSVSARRSASAAARCCARDPKCRPGGRPRSISRSSRCGPTWVTPRARSRARLARRASRNRRGPGGRIGGRLPIVAERGFVGQMQGFVGVLQGAVTLGGAIRQPRRGFRPRLPDRTRFARPPGRPTALIVGRRRLRPAQSGAASALRW